MIEYTAENYNKKIFRNNHFHYLKENFHKIYFRISFILISTCIWFWIKFFYFSWMIQSIEENPTALALVFFWLWLSQIYILIQFFDFQKIEKLCVNDLWDIPWGWMNVWKYETRIKYLRKHYAGHFSNIITICNFLLYLLCFIGIWFSFFQVVLYVFFILISHFHFTVIYFIFYDSILVCLWLIFLLVWIYYLYYTNKNDRDITKKPLDYSLHLFYYSRDNRIFTKNLYKILSILSLLIVSQVIYNLYVDAGNSKKYFWPYRCTDNCSLYLSWYNFANTKEAESIAGNLSFDKCNILSTVSDEGCQYYILQKTTGILVASFTPVVVIFGLMGWWNS